MKDKELAALKDEHTRVAVTERLATGSSSSLQDWVLGAVDGAITTFAIVAGVLGAGLSAGVVVILGVANLIADGLSMAASRYLGAQAELERRENARRREHNHIDLVPDGESEEVRQLLAAKGFVGDDLNTAVGVITDDRETWVEFMLTEELGFPPEPDRPLAAASATFLGFVAVGVLPIAPFVIDVAMTPVASPTAWSVGLTAAAFCIVGAIKGHVVGVARLPAALRTLAVGGTAATLAFVISVALRDLA